MTLLNIPSAQQRYPRLFEALRAAGWSEDRDVPIPEAMLDATASLGFFPSDFQEELLHSFYGLEVRVEYQSQWGRPAYGGLVVGLGKQLEYMNARDHVGYIRRLAKTPEIFPIIMSGGNAVFGLEDGRCLAIEVSFRGCVWSAEPFEMMDWLLFATSGPGIEVRELTMDERPPIFRW